MSVAVAVSASVAAQDHAVRNGRRLVVTTEVLGSVVGDLVGDAADVTVLMSAGVDPHSWQPSARDSQTVFEADLIVANGLDLEEGLVSVLEQAEAEGVPVFHATDHVAIRGSAGTEEHPDEARDHAGEAGAEGDSDADPGHEHKTGDPHFWLDPLAMRDVVLVLGPVMSDAGIDIADRADLLAADLEALHSELTGTLAAVPDERRQLVTGHGALGYFADRYGFRIIGTVIPGLSSSDEPSAKDIAELIESIRAAGTTAVFSDVGTPASVAEAVAAETGAQVVELRVAQLPASGSYADLLREIAAAIANALAA